MKKALRTALLMAAAVFVVQSGSVLVPAVAAAAAPKTSKKKHKIKYKKPKTKKGNKHPHDGKRS